MTSLHSYATYRSAVEQLAVDGEADVDPEELLEPDDWEFIEQSQRSIYRFVSDQDLHPLFHSTLESRVAETARSYFSILVLDASNRIAALHREKAEAVSERVVRELGRIKDGWAGENSKAPAQQILDDIELALNRLPPDASSPLIEIDEEDGVVALRWIAEDRLRSFSLVFTGNERVVCIQAHVQPPRSDSLALDVREDIPLTALLEEPSIRELITA